MKPKIIRLFIFLLLSGLITYNFICETGPSPVSPTHMNCDTISTVGRWDFNAVTFINPFKGIAVGNLGMVTISRDGGNTWIDPPFSITSSNLYSVGAVDTLTIVAVGQNGKIKRTTDGGISWDSIQVNTLQTLRTVAFYSSLGGYAAGDSGVVFSTTDAGTSWNKIHGDSAQSIHGLSYNSNDTVVFVGESGLVLMGLAFTPVIVGTSLNLNSIHFALDSTYLTHINIGFIVGDSGIVLKSTNGGPSWAIDTVIPPNNLKSVYLTSYHWGYAAGVAGTILRYNGHIWKLLAQKTQSTLNGIDGSIYSVTDICVGEDGTVGIVCPDAVTEPGYNISANTTDCAQWDFTLTLPTLLSGSRYNSLTASSSSVLDQTHASAMSGWAVYDHYGEHSFEGLNFGEENLLSPYWVTTSGRKIYITCCLKDIDGNPWLLGKYKCGP